MEFCLSDKNLAKDAFLQKNKMGFISLKLLMSFKKVGSPWCWAAGVGNGLHVEDVGVSGCALLSLVECTGRSRLHSGCLCPGEVLMVQSWALLFAFNVLQQFSRQGGWLGKR